MKTTPSSPSKRTPFQWAAGIVLWVIAIFILLGESSLAHKASLILIGGACGPVMHRRAKKKAEAQVAAWHAAKKNA